ncbi:MAG: PIN domain-containing protein [Polaromonas sp.]
MNVLVESSVWVGHFRQRNERLVALLEEGRVVCHPHVVAEVACGTPPNRRSIIAMLAELESTPVASQEELLALMERRNLYGRGCGFVDMSLLASALLSGQTLLWTLDKRLESVATEVNVAYRPGFNA